MIIETPKILLYCLVATTLLGAVMGYCMAWLRAKRRTRAELDRIQSEFRADKDAVESELHSATLNNADLRQSLAQTQKQATVASQREEALEVHSQLQSQRIQSLEAQVSSYEDQQIRLQRDFANYKSNKSRELELARNKPDSWSEANQLPVLKKRIEDQQHDSESQPVIAVPESGDVAISTKTERARATASAGGLSTPLSRELDIPSLSETELPDSVDELEFEMADPDDAETSRRG